MWKTIENLIELSKLLIGFFYRNYTDYMVLLNSEMEMEFLIKEKRVHKIRFHEIVLLEIINMQPFILSSLLIAKIVNLTSESAF